MPKSLLPEPALEPIAKSECGVVVPIPRLLPSNTNPVPLVATLDAFKYNTPLAVPAPKVGLLVSVVMDAEVLIRLVIVAEALVSVVILAEAMLRLLMTMLVAVRLVTVAEVAVSVVIVALVEVN